MNRYFFSDFGQRLAIGKESESAFEKFCHSKNLNVVFVSTHRDKPKASVVRHFPDYFVVDWAAFVQIKNGKESGKWSTVIAQKESIDTCNKIHGFGSKVIVAWEMPDGSFHGNYIEKLDIVAKISEDARKNGSGTAAYRINKTSLKKL